MTAKRTIGIEPRPPPKPLNLGWTPSKGRALTFWLPDDEFEAAAVKHGISKEKDGFAVPQRWWTRHPHIYMRARMLSVFPHEAHHVEDFLAGRRRFHI